MIVEKPNVFSFCETNAIKFGAKNYISHTIIYQHMISCYIFMIIVDSYTAQKSSRSLVAPAVMSVIVMIF